MPVSGVLVTVRRYARIIDAQMARARLEAHGIEAILPDEHYATIDPLLVGAIGNVRLQVRHADLKEALTILDAPPAEHDDVDELEEGPRCPECETTYCRSEWTAGQLVLGI